jgi:hypothetical protein
MFHRKRVVLERCETVCHDRISRVSGIRKKTEIRKLILFDNFGTFHEQWFAVPRIDKGVKKNTKKGTDVHYKAQEKDIRFSFEHQSSPFIIDALIS